MQVRVVLPAANERVVDLELHPLGLYYPLDSLKMKLCIRGRKLLYDRCEAHGIPFKKTGKLVVARADQRVYLKSLHAKAQEYEKSRSWPFEPLPTKLISGAEARALEPNLHKDIAAALWSPETGIVDSHALMESLEKDILDSENAELVYSTKVVRLDHDWQKRGWAVQVVTGDAAEGDALWAKHVFNCAGLSAPYILNGILPRERRIPMFFARGSYASYRGPGVENVSHLIYPCPAVGKDRHAFHSLGTHLTMDLQGKIRFGPDLDWLDPPENYADPDFWQQHLVPDDSRLQEMYEAVKEYLPEVSRDGFQPDYCGVRPKIAMPGEGFRDFLFYPSPEAGPLEGRMFSLLGIESPGLTSSLAIAEYVAEVLLEGRGYDV